MPGKDSEKNLKALCAALEAGQYNQLPGNLPEPASIEVKSLVKEFPELWPPDLMASFSNLIKSTVYVEETLVRDRTSKWKPYRVARSCQYLSVTVKTFEEVKSVATMFSTFLERLDSEGQVIGYLATPSYLNLTAQDDKFAVFCFLFTRLTDAEMKLRAPTWAQEAGAVGSKTTPVNTSGGVVALSPMNRDLYVKAFNRPDLGMFGDREHDTLWKLADSVCVLKTMRGLHVWPAPKCQADIEDVYTTFSMELDIVEEIFMTEKALKDYCDTLYKK